MGLDLSRQRNDLQDLVSSRNPRNRERRAIASRGVLFFVRSGRSAHQNELNNPAYASA